MDGTLAGFVVVGTVDGPTEGLAVRSAQTTQHPCSSRIDASTSIIESSSISISLSLALAKVGCTRPGNRSGSGVQIESPIGLFGVEKLQHGFPSHSQAVGDAL